METPATRPPAPEKLSPVAEAEAEAEAEADAMFASRMFCCFPWTRSRPSVDWWERMPENEQRPMSTKRKSCGFRKRGLKAVMKLREWSELVAGPRWKTFIRRINGRRTARRWKRIQYDPLSYALNFDDGRGQDEGPDCRDFSFRYAAVPASIKASMDLDGALLFAAPV